MHKLCSLVQKDHFNLNYKYLKNQYLNTVLNTFQTIVRKAHFANVLNYRLLNVF